MSTHTFTPTRAAALKQLERFAPSAGRAYQNQRNYDFGPESHKRVSQLSPYLRHRIISETEVIAAVLGQHAYPSAEKFIQEIYWRTYWKGWLEHRPGVWHDYTHHVTALQSRLTTDADLHESYETAKQGRTGIEPFDAWIHELTTTGYLHNHARMWFASIWIFTLELPWQLGAEFFIHHLLDGDPASNTLSWRWVAGLQTQGKIYLATAENLRQFAGKRFFSHGEPKGLERLAPHAAPIDAPLPPPATAPTLPDDPTSCRNSGLLLSEDDLLLETPITVATVAAWQPQHTANCAPAEPVTGFRRALMRDALERAAHTNSTVVEKTGLNDYRDVLTWARGHNLEQVIVAYPPQGHVRDTLEELKSVLLRAGISLAYFVREHDRRTWPHAKRGFFQLKKKIPELLDL